MSDAKAIKDIALAEGASMVKIGSKYPTFRNGKGTYYPDATFVKEGFLD